MENKENISEQRVEIEYSFGEVKKFFQTGATLPLSYRLKALNSLADAILKYESEILKALYADLGKSKTEAYITEIVGLKTEIKYFIKNLKRLAAPQTRTPVLEQAPSRLRVIYEPYGVALIISPWNYPFLLSLAPLIDAIAAGNCAIVKPSAYSPRVSAVIKKVCKAAFEPGHVTVIEGGREENNALLDMKFDYIFFTGSPEVGKVVMKAASKNLVPVTLELGGKSPCIVDDTADINKAARRILFGKLTNSGQTCIAPDYVLVKENVKDELISQLLLELNKAIPNAEYFRNSFGKIVNKKHFERLLSLLQCESPIYPTYVKKWDYSYIQNKNGILADYERRKMFPVLLDDPNPAARVMQEEIFGPILPIINWSNAEAMQNNFKYTDKPLALYIFSEDRKFVNDTIRKISSGGVTVNDTLMHLVSPDAPFGGVGKSGMGNYHGAAGFRTFSHERTVLFKSTAIEIPMRSHPYSERTFRLFKKIFK